MELRVKRAKEGDKDELLKLIMDEKDNYYKLAYVYMKNKEDSLEVIQDMIIIIYKEISKLKKLNSFYSWSKTILVNLCKKELEKNKKIKAYESVIKNEVEITLENEKDISNIQDSIYLKELIEKLNDKQKEVIKLRYFLDYSYEEIATILKIPIGTVKSRLNKGISKLRKDIGGEIKYGYR